MHAETTKSEESKPMTIYEWTTQIRNPRVETDRAEMPPRLLRSQLGLHRVRRVGSAGGISRHWPAQSMLFCIYGLPGQIDLTRRGSFTLAPQTRNLLASLRTPVEVTVLAPGIPKTALEHNFRNAAEMFSDLLEDCRRIQPLLHVQELDPTESAAARQLQQQFPDLLPPCVLITFGSESNRLPQPRSPLRSRPGRVSFRRCLAPPPGRVLWRTVAGGGTGAADVGHEAGADLCRDRSRRARARRCRPRKPSWHGIAGRNASRSRL